MELFLTATKKKHQTELNLGGRRKKKDQLGAKNKRKGTEMG